jgi:UDP-N-acetylglucosamine--dolichyl-phosphate N-acetylglucosaminephosphotransferase
MKVCGGISERNLVLVLMGIEAVVGVMAILLYI